MIMSFCSPYHQTVVIPCGSKALLNRSAMLAFICIAVLAVTVSASYAAQSPFGVALPETTTVRGSGPFQGFFLWVAQQQSAFYKEMIEAVQAIKTSPSAAWFLVGLSFLYGVFHAAGPGHGKVVLSSYVLASNDTARTGVLISFAAAMMQAVSAIVLIGIAAIILNMTSIAITETTAVFETGSYALVAALGVFLVWKKVAQPLIAKLSSPQLQVAPSHGSAGIGHAAVGHEMHSHEGHAHVHHDHSHHDHSHHGHDHCCHMAGADQAAAIVSSATPFKDAIAAIVAVGLRPCSGALIVLVFALSQGVFWVGILSTFAMAFGTGIIVAALVILSVTARETAVRMAGRESRLAGRLQAGFEGVAAVLVLGLGLTLLYASLLQPILI